MHVVLVLQDAHLAQAQQIAAWNLDFMQDLLPGEPGC